jgi:hypothetical protein
VRRACDRPSYETAARAAILFLVGSLLSGDHAWARDLPKTDPDRRAILNAIPRDEVGQKLVVKDLVRFGDFAYVCSLFRTPDGYIQHTDESIDLGQWVLLRDGARWLPLPSGGGFAESTTYVDCAPNGLPKDVHRIRGEADIKRVYVATLGAALVDELTLGNRPGLMPLLVAFDVLRARDPAFDLPVEGAKSEILLGRHQAGDPSSAEVRAVRDDPALSAYQWNRCEVMGMRSNFDVNKECAADPVIRQACPSHMMLGRDRAAVDNCERTLQRLCLARVPTWACFQFSPLEGGVAK